MSVEANIAAFPQQNRAPEPSSTDLAAAKAAARRIIDQNPRATLTQLVALGWFDGRIALCEQLRPSIASMVQSLPEIAPAATAIYDNSATCQCCGQKDRLASRVPFTAEQLNGYICRRCLSGDGV